MNLILILSSKDVLALKADSFNIIRYYNMNRSNDYNAIYCCNRKQLRFAFGVHGNERGTEKRT